MSKLKLTIGFVQVVILSLRKIERGQKIIGGIDQKCIGREIAGEEEVNKFDFLR